MPGSSRDLRWHARGAEVSFVCLSHPGEKWFWRGREAMLEFTFHCFFGSMGRLGLCSSATLCLPYLGIIECASHSHPLVAGCQTMVFQYPLATISVCLLGYLSISGALDKNPRQLAQKRILPHRFIQFHRRFCSHLMQKGHLRTLFIASFTSLALLKQPKSRDCDSLALIKSRSSHYDLCHVSFGSTQTEMVNCYDHLRI